MARMNATSRLVLLALLLLSAVAAGTWALDPEKRLTQLATERWGLREGLPSLGVFAVAHSDDGYLWLGIDDGLVRFDGAMFDAFHSRNTPALGAGPVFALDAGSGGRLWIGAADGSVLMRDGRRIERLAGTDSEATDGVMAILEDRSGHLWVWREHSGLARYRIDGTTLADVGLPPILAEQTPPPQQVPRRSIVEGRDGRLWLASQGDGLYVLDRDRLTRVTSTEGLSDDFVHTVAEDLAGDIWIGSHGGLDRYRGGEIEAMTSAVGLGAGGVVALKVDSAGSLWINQRGLFRWTGSRLELLEGTDDIRGELSLAEDHDGGLWVGALGDDLVSVRDDGVTPLGPAEGFPISVVLSVAGDPDGSLWVGTSRAGVVVLEEGERRSISTADGLPHNLVWSIHRQGAETWLGTNGGLARMVEGEMDVFTTADGLPGDRVRTIHEDPDAPGTLWLGTIDGGVARLRNGAFSSLTAADGLAQTNVRWLQRDTAGGLWIGLHNGLQRLQIDPDLRDLKEGQLETFTKADGLASTRMRAAYLDSGGTLWVGTAGGGLSRFHDGRFTSYTRAAGLLSDDVYGILPDSEGNLWLAGHGVTRIARQDFDDFDAGRIERLRPEAFPSPSFDRTECCVAGGSPGLWQGVDGRLWFPGAKGIASLDPAALESRYRLPPAVVESVVADGASISLTGEPVPAGVRDLRIEYTSPRLAAAEQLSFRYRLIGHDDEWTEVGARREAYYSRLPPGRYQFQVTASAEPGWWRIPLRRSRSASCLSGGRRCGSGSPPCSLSSARPPPGTGLAPVESPSTTGNCFGRSRIVSGPKMLYESRSPNVSAPKRPSASNEPRWPISAG